MLSVLNPYYRLDRFVVSCHWDSGVRSFKFKRASCGIYRTRLLLTMGYDPNFPPDLLIKPLAQGADWGQVFSPASQAAAIEKYGIAGRVWYVHG